MLHAFYIDTSLLRICIDLLSFVVVQGLWLPPETAEADAAPQSTDALPVEGFHGINSGHGLGWLRSATHNRLYAEGLGGRYQLYVFQGPARRV